MLIFKELILCAQYNKNQNDQIRAYSNFPGGSLRDSPAPLLQRKLFFKESVKSSQELKTVLEKKSPSRE